MRVGSTGPSVEALPSSPARAPSDAPTAPMSTAPAPGERSPFARLMHGLGRELTHGEASTRAAIQASRAGVDLTPADLIALQAGIYRYNEVVEITSKLVDHAASSIKTVLQGSGQ